MRAKKEWSPTEKSTLKTIRDGLRALGKRCYINRNQQGLGCDPGRPDLEGSMRIMGLGRHFGIEVKAPTGKLSTHQQAHRQAILDAGGIFIEAHSWEDVVMGFEQVGFPLPFQGRLTG